ncbi:MAG TPA: hypothetical protein VGO78_02190 [Acidimicrobiales bacterium]|nr:hypothetical protein [Acidimicrobiales bacterium]
MVTDPSADPAPSHGQPAPAPADAGHGHETDRVADPAPADGQPQPDPEPADAGHGHETDRVAEAGLVHERETNRAAETVPPAGPVTEDRIVRVDLWATVVFAVVSVGAALWSGLLVPAVAVDIGLFVAGCAAFLYAYLRGIGRSRDDAISLAGLFFLMEGVAPRRVARALWLLLAAQVVVAVATAAARPFSSLAFGILAPMFGLALLALWGAVHGRFPPRVAPATPATPADSEPDGAADDGPTGDEA